jgi:hypothetical protein
MSVIEHDRARTEGGSSTETEWSHRRSIMQRILWGSESEFCAECGTELRGAAVYRESLQKAYCSVEHANFDRD